MWPSFLNFLTTRCFGRPLKRGQTLVEYSLILAVLTIVFIASFSLLSKELIKVFSAITTMLDSAQSSSF
jgi:Flp pilus assembly pilin Flp